MKTACTVILAAAMAVGALAADESKTEKGKCERGDVVSVSLRRGKTVETCEVKVAVRDNGMSLVIPRTELEGVDSLSVVPDFAHARTGEEGFFALADGMVGDFTATSGEYRLGSPPMAFWGMKTPRRTFVCEVTGMELSHGVCVTVTNGEYTVATEFSFGDETPYEDVSLDWTFLPDSAGYPDMAKVYRSHQLASGRVKTIRERLAAQPDLAYISTSVEIRVRQAWKPAPSPVLEQNASNEPQMKVAMTFDRTLEFVEACAEAGVGPAEFCLVGWNYRGHDGRYPQLWPVEPQLGGEDGLRHLISATQAKGFRIVLHNNHTDAYSVGECFDLSDIAKKKDGMPVSNKGSKYVWSGGTSYTMCPRRAWERFAMDDLAKVAALGAHGLHYIDVLTIGPPAVCHDTRHPCTRRDSARYIGRMLALARKLMGGSASEGPYDFCAGDYDFCLYASYADPAGRKLPPLVTRTVPMWQLVYHGIILSMPFAGCTNYTIKPGSARLAMVEYGGRPVFYLYSNFMDGMQWMGNEDLRVGSPAELADAVAKIKKGADEFSQVADLQFELMEDHRLLAPGVALTSYANGAGTVVNRSDRPFFHKGVCIPSGDWRRF